jgi:predicted CXXCH cytochrome family protein
MLLIAAGSLWLFLAAVPAFADGGPHVKAINSGAGTGSTLTADSCAGCHRAHTAQGSYLLAAPDEEALCLTCHGAAGTGASTDVESGIQYTLASRDGSTGTVLGALRGGGFIDARIDSANPSRLTYQRTTTDTSQRTKVPVLATGAPVTSSHIELAAGVVSTGIAWGNGPISATIVAGQPLAMECASCHNPHGNGNYRILNPLPGNDDTATVEGPFVEPTTEALVTDAALPGAGDARNYTVIQLRNNTGSMTANEVLAIPGISNTAGDYFHRTVPWDPQVDDTVIGSSTGLTSNDAPNGLPTTFNAQINAWCSQCHSRYLAGSGAWSTDSGDAVFTYRHTNTSNKPCTTCHVAHGTNAAMPGTAGVVDGLTSSAFPYPNGDISGSSRLLKIDNRGTCQACHDPTATVTAGTESGPVPVPYVP